MFYKLHTAVPEIAGATRRLNLNEQGLELSLLSLPIFGMKRSLEFPVHRTYKRAFSLGTVAQTLWRSLHLRLLILHPPTRVPTLKTSAKEYFEPLPPDNVQNSKSVLSH